MPRPFWYLQVSQTVGAPAGDSQTVPHKIPDRRAQKGDFQRVCDGAKTVRATAGDSQTVQEISQDRRGTYKRLSDSLRRCQDFLGTSRRLPDSLSDLEAPAVSPR
ncbi:hypothetical protein DPMN_192363 [Dreissena polymorpha]|uniref:Uncharacterized protein n=1 Tax=Dreissena polymorpha TaxID=45954 RepID=A0A9D3XZP4_DREPO|nr:hypothetical protein DPMN_192363 [Dreissena polymorpha]